jgi:Family of unknown function (DUF6338)
MFEEIGAIVALSLALVPGALYVWAYERQAGGKSIGFSDRVVRFVGGSAIFHAAFAPLTYWTWSELWPRVTEGEPLSWAAWLLPITYVLVPIVVGTYIGNSVQRSASWTRLLTGPQPVPRAWDYLFHHQLDGWIRVRLKSGEWIAGAFADANGRRSYAASYPEPQDLYLAAAVHVDPESGEFEVTDDGEIELLPGGLLVRWEEVEYLEFTDA